MKHVHKSQIYGFLSVTLQAIILSPEYLWFATKMLFALCPINKSVAFNPEYCFVLVQKKNSLNKASHANVMF